MLEVIKEWEVNLQEIRGGTTNLGYKFEQKCTTKETLSTSAGRLLNNVPCNPWDRSSIQLWDTLTALKNCSPTLISFTCSLSPSLISHLPVSFYSFAKPHSASNVKNVTGKSQPRWSLHSHMWPSVSWNIPGEISTPRLRTQIPSFRLDALAPCLVKKLEAPPALHLYSRPQDENSGQFLMQQVPGKANFQHTNSIATGCYEKTALVGQEWKAMTSTSYIKLMY